jgi:hypothetical protein
LYAIFISLMGAMYPIQLIIPLWAP